MRQHTQGLGGRTVHLLLLLLSLQETTLMRSQRGEVGGRREGGGGGGVESGGGASAGAACLMWQLEIVRMRGDTELQHPQSRGRSSSRTVSQSLSESPALFTLVLLTRVCVSVCVCVCPCFSSGNRYGRSDNVAWPSVSRPAKWHACQLSWQTLSSCWPAMAAANVGHVSWQSDTASTTRRRVDRTHEQWSLMRVGSPLRGPGSGRAEWRLQWSLHSRRSRDRGCTSLKLFCS